MGIIKGKVENQSLEIWLKCEDIGQLFQYAFLISMGVYIRVNVVVRCKRYLYIKCFLSCSFH